MYMCSLYLYIQICNRAPWKNSVTEWFMNIFEINTSDISGYGGLNIPFKHIIIA